MCFLRELCISASSRAILWNVWGTGATVSSAWAVEQGEFCIPWNTFCSTVKSWSRKGAREKNWGEKKHFWGRNSTCKMQMFLVLACGITWKEGAVLNSLGFLSAHSSFAPWIIFLCHFKVSDAGIWAFLCEWNGLHVTTLRGWCKSISFTWNTNIYFLIVMNKYSWNTKFLIKPLQLPIEQIAIKRIRHTLISVIFPIFSSVKLLSNRKNILCSGSL